MQDLPNGILGDVIGINIPDGKKRNTVADLATTQHYFRKIHQK